MSATTLLFPPETLRTFLGSLLQAYGATAANAATVADHLVESSLCGHHSHGIIRVPQYLEEVRAGKVDPTATPRLTSGHGPRRSVDGERGFGQVAAGFAVHQALESAAGHGLGLVTVRRCGHVGRVGVYPEAIARRGMLGLAFCSASPPAQRVAYFGGREGRLSTNPIAYAFPTGGDPVLGDFATSAIAEGKIRSLRNRGLPAPAGALRDAAGAPTTDPDALYAEPPGTLQPLGGPDFGYKGSALALLVEAMATLFAGEDPMDASRHGNILTLLAIAPDDGFAERAARLVARLRAVTPIDPARPVMIPGEPERRARESAPGVMVDPPTWEAISALAAGRGLALPTPLA